MEGHIQIFETPDHYKTIEEINEEIEPKTFSQNLAIESKPIGISISKIHEMLSTKSTSKQNISYNQQQPLKRVQPGRIESLEAELNQLKQLIPEDAKEAEELLNQIKLKLNTQKVEAKPFEVPEPTIKKKEKLAEGFKLELAVREERGGLWRLDNKVKLLEYALGEWNQTKTVAQTLAELIGRTRFLSPVLLEKLETQAKHLGTDLEIMLTSKAEVQVEPDVLSLVQSLHHDVSSHLQSLPMLPLLLKRIKHAVPFHKAHLELDVELFDLETSADQLVSSLNYLQQNIDSVKEGIKENNQALQENLASLNK